MIKTTRTLMALTLLFACRMTASAAAAQVSPAMISLADFGAKPDSGADATPAFQTALVEAAKHSGPVTLRIPKGRYDLFDRHASRRVFFASNACDTDGMHTIAIDIKGLNNLTIDGQGSLLMMRGKMTMLVADECENLSVNDLTLDYGERGRTAVRELIGRGVSSGLIPGPVEVEFVG